MTVIGFLAVTPTVANQIIHKLKFKKKSGNCKFHINNELSKY